MSQSSSSNLYPRRETDCNVNDLPYRLREEKSKVSKLFGKYGIVFVFSVNNYVRFDFEHFEDGSASDLSDWDLVIGEVVYVDAVLKNTCCTPYSATRVWRKPFRKRNLTNNEISSSRSSLPSDKSNFITKFGSIEVLKDAYGFITFDSHNQFVFFSLDNLQNVSTHSYSSLDQLLFEGQFVKFTAIPNPKICGRAKWKATAVWSKLPENKDTLYELTLSVNSDCNYISDDLIGTVDSLFSTYGYIAYGPSKNKLVVFKKFSIRDENNFDALEDILRIGQTVKFSLLSSKKSSGISHASNVWIHNLSLNDSPLTVDGKEKSKYGSLALLPQDRYEPDPSSSNTARRSKSQISLNDMSSSDDFNSLNEEPNFEECIGTIDFIGARFGYITSDKFSKDLIYFHITSVVDICDQDYGCLEDFMSIGQRVLFIAVPNTRTKAKWAAKHVWTEIIEKNFPVSTFSSHKSVRGDHSSKNCSDENICVVSSENDSEYKRISVEHNEATKCEEYIGTITDLNFKHGTIMFGELGKCVAHFHIDVVQHMGELARLEDYFFIGQKVIFSIDLNQKTRPDNKLFAKSVWTECVDSSLKHSEDSVIKGTPSHGDGLIENNTEYSTFHEDSSLCSSSTVNFPKGSYSEQCIEDIGTVVSLNCTYGYIKFRNVSRDERVYFHREKVQDAQCCGEFLEDFMFIGQKVKFCAVKNLKPTQLSSSEWVAKFLWINIEDIKSKVYFNNDNKNSNKRGSSNSLLKTCNNEKHEDKSIEDSGTVESLNNTHGYISFGKSEIDSVYFHIKSVANADGSSRIEDALHVGQTVKFIAFKNFSKPYWCAEKVWPYDLPLCSEDSTIPAEVLASDECMEVEKNIEEFGNIERLCSSFGYIEFKNAKGNYEQAFFHRNKVIDIKSKEGVLVDVMYVGQRVYFAAIPNLKKSTNKAQWYATSVWFRNSSIAQKISSNDKSQQIYDNSITSSCGQQNFQTITSWKDNASIKSAALNADSTKVPKSNVSSDNESSNSLSECVSHHDDIESISSSDESYIDDDKNTTEIISNKDEDIIGNKNLGILTATFESKHLEIKDASEELKKVSNQNFSNISLESDVTHTQSLSKTSKGFVSKESLIVADTSTASIHEKNILELAEFDLENTQNINNTETDIEIQHKDLTNTTDNDLASGYSSVSETSIKTVIENNPHEISKNILKEAEKLKKMSEVHSDTDVSKSTKLTTHVICSKSSIDICVRDKNIKIGIIYSLAANFGHINFGPSKDNLAFFYLSAVRDAESTTLNGILTVGQTVRFVAVPNKRLNSHADWYATDVWIHEEETWKPILCNINNKKKSLSAKESPQKLLNESHESSTPATVPSISQPSICEKDDFSLYGTKDDDENVIVQHTVCNTNNKNVTLSTAEEVLDSSGEYSSTEDATPAIATAFINQPSICENDNFSLNDAKDGETLLIAKEVLEHSSGEEFSNETATSATVPSLSQQSSSQHDQFSGASNCDNPLDKMVLEEVLSREDVSNEVSNHLFTDKISLPDKAAYNKDSTSENSEPVSHSDEFIRNGLGQLFPICDSEATINFDDSGDCGIQVLDNCVYENGNQISNLLLIENGKEVKFDAIKIYPDIWIASAVWIGSKPNMVGLSEDSLNNEIERLTKLYSHRNDHLLGELIKELQDFL